MQLFDIKVFVYSDRMEIKGAIPPQLLGMKNVKKTLPAPIIGLGREIQRVDFRTPTLDTLNGKLLHFSCPPPE
jgi:hypothetical protein